MKTFTLNRTAVLSIMAIAFLFGITSCAKSNLKKDINGGWALNTFTQDGVDNFAQMGATNTGVWIFDKNAETCHITNTFTSSFGNETTTQTFQYTVEDKESIILDGEMMKVEELGSNNMVLSITQDGEFYEYYFTK